ncbi:SDR family oxidoreductase [Rhizobium sp. 25PS6]|uniref:SDR family oxidoreductase n=1 Tax=Rhizobium sp. 25PS6 TaxID=3075622 RepID=UPI0028FD99E5|nr:SDR family oxidoreductase [Rhizobium sp. 25PS6]MDU0360177.1 SDR family oxidoreductase [Rhizobium sp. 25PS6]
MTLLNDKIAIITGASSGIGRAAAKLFARQGAKLVVTGRRQDALDAVIAEIEAEGGQAVAISGDVSMAAYAASKAGLIGFVQVLAAELGAQKIRVNALLPGGTDTPASITNAPDATPEVLAFVEGLHALKRMAQPEEIANAALFLASDMSSFVTGAAMLADGGVSISRT